MTRKYLVNSTRKLLIKLHGIRSWSATLKMWKEFLIIRSTYSIYPSSLLTTHITHDCSGFEQVDPLLTLYKRNKSYSPKVSPTIHYFPLCSREKIDLTVRESLAGLHQSPLIVLSFLFKTKKPPL